MTQSILITLQKYGFFLNYNNLFNFIPAFGRNPFRHLAVISSGIWLTKKIPTATSLYSGFASLRSRGNTQLGISCLDARNTVSVLYRLPAVIRALHEK